MDVLSEAIVETPVGPLWAVASGRGLCILEFRRDDRVSLEAGRLRRWYGGAVPRREANPHLARTRAWLATYFLGRFDELEAPPLDARGTPFELAVWRAMRAIRIGEVSTYAALASRLGVPRGARAVGAASGRNPVCLVTPCHRVVGTVGALVGYGGGLDLKRWLLEHEGAVPSLGASPAPAARAR